MPDIQIPNIVIVILQIILAFGAAFFIALWVSMIIWTFRDVRSRSRDVFAILLATLMVVVFGLLGLLLYLLLRPRETLAEIYEQIDRLETSEITTESYMEYDERYRGLVRTCIRRRFATVVVVLGAFAFAVERVHAFLASGGHLDAGRVHLVTNASGLEETLASLAAARIAAPSANRLEPFSASSTGMASRASSMYAMNASSSVAAPLASTSSSGSPTARTRPACISEMRSQRIASFMKWVEMKMVTPCSRERSEVNT